MESDQEGDLYILIDKPLRKTFVVLSVMPPECEKDMAEVAGKARVQFL